MKGSLLIVCLSCPTDETIPGHLITDAERERAAGDPHLLYPGDHDYEHLLGVCENAPVGLTIVFPAGADRAAADVLFGRLDNADRLRAAGLRARVDKARYRGQMAIETAGRVLISPMRAA